MPVWDEDEVGAPANQPQTIAQRVRDGNALPILSHGALFDLALFGHTLARGQVDHDGLYHHGLGMVHFYFFALFQQNFFALAHRQLAHFHVMRTLALFTASLHLAIKPATQFLGYVHPRKTEHQCRANHTQGDGHQARARKTQPFHADGAQ